MNNNSMVRFSELSEKFARAKKALNELQLQLEDAREVVVNELQAKLAKEYLDGNKNILVVVITQDKMNVRTVYLKECLESETDFYSPLNSELYVFKFDYINYYLTLESPKYIEVVHKYDDEDSRDCDILEKGSSKFIQGLLFEVS